MTHIYPEPAATLDNRAIITVTGGIAELVRTPKNMNVTIVDLDELPEIASGSETLDELHALNENIEYLRKDGPFAADAAQQVHILLTKIYGTS